MDMEELSEEQLKNVTGGTEATAIDVKNITVTAEKNDIIINADGNVYKIDTTVENNTCPICNSDKFHSLRVTFPVCGVDYFNCKCDNCGLSVTYDFYAASRKK